MLAVEAPEGVSIALHEGTNSVPTTWQMPSPRLAEKYPGAENAHHAHFRAAPVSGTGPLRLVVTWPGGSWSCTGPQGRGDPDSSLLAIRRRIDLLLGQPDRDPGDYDSVVAALTRISPTDRDTAWREAMALADAAYLRNPQRLWRIVRRLRRDEPTSADFDRFWSTLRQALGPYTINAHGYQRALRDHDRAGTLRYLRDLVDVLTTMGHRAFLNSGTLLGFVREGDLIGHDDDIDLGLVLTAGTTSDAAVEWVRVIDRLGRSGLLHPGWEEQTIYHAKMMVPGREPAGCPRVDLFPAWVVDDSVYVWPHTFGTVAADSLLPLGQQSAHGVDLPVPHRPMDLLASNYGPGWRHPDPAWAFDWRHARTVFKDFLTTLDDCRRGSR